MIKLIKNKKGTLQLRKVPFRTTLKQNNYLIIRLNDLPGVKPGVFLAAKVIFAPVLGFLPIRDFLDRKLKVPNPVRTTFSPLLRESCTVFKKV